MYIVRVSLFVCVSPIVRNGIKRWRRDKTSDAGLTDGQKRKILINDLRGDFFSSPVVNVTAMLLTAPTVAQFAAAPCELESVYYTYDQTKAKTVVEMMCGRI